MLQRNTSELVASLDECAESWPKAVIRTTKALKDFAFCAIQPALHLMTDPAESALRNCNAALQNGGMQELFARSSRNPGG